MHTPQIQVQTFHEALDIPVGQSPRLRRGTLRAELIREESLETIEAIHTENFLQAIDGLCDILVVTYGAAVEWGIDLEPFFNEIHITNLAKRGGPIRADGKRLKPMNWQPPNLAPILNKQL